MNPIEFRHVWVLFGGFRGYRTSNFRLFSYFWLVSKIAPSFFIRFWWNFRNSFFGDITSTLLNFVTFGWFWGVLGDIAPRIFVYFRFFWLFIKISRSFVIWFWWNFRNSFISDITSSLLNFVTFGWFWGVLGEIAPRIFGYFRIFSAC